MYKRQVKARSNSRYKKRRSDSDFHSKKMYQAQIERSAIRGHEAPSYTYDEFHSWLVMNEYDSMLKAWVNSGMKKNLAPSVDRIDNSIGYTIDNIRLVTWRKNLEAAFDYFSENCKCKKLLRIDIDNGTVTEYVSVSAAVRDMGYKVEYQIKNQVPCRNGFYWKYK